MGVAGALRNEKRRINIARMVSASGRSRREIGGDQIVSGDLRAVPSGFAVVGGFDTHTARARATMSSS